MESIPHARTPLTVTELVRTVRSTLQSALGLAWVAGEVSNFRRPSSGHIYFTLKDSGAQLRCVLFRSDAARLGFAPQDGMQVIVSGHVDVYEPRGDLQIRVTSLKAAGEGALQKAFEELKLRLREEGLFDVALKKPLPAFPKRIGIVTSRTGAALHDILTVLGRRYPVVEVVLAPVAVQGLEAGGQIAEAIQRLDSLPESQRPEVLIVGRGGGSTEDLWSFNEERVARAVSTCRIPVVSAVGHETDTAITDFVADVRAATPSMAAEIVVPDQKVLSEHMLTTLFRAKSYVRSLISIDRRRLHHLVRSHGFNRPLYQLEQLYQRGDDLVERLSVAQNHRLAAEVNRVSSLSRQLYVLDPRRTLERGYVRVERNEAPVTRAADLEPDDIVRLFFADTHRDARITR